MVSLQSLRAMELASRHSAALLLPSPRRRCGPRRAAPTARVAAPRAPPQFAPLRRRQERLGQLVRGAGASAAPLGRGGARRLCGIPRAQGEAGAAEEEPLAGWERALERLGEALSSAFPLWVGLACVLALARPGATTWITQGVQFSSLSIIMLGMGMTLTPKDIEGAFAMPKELVAGIVLQYTVMPSMGYAVSRLLQLPPHYAAGLILVSCCPGGTASNIVTYLARGNVALSVLMTAASTFLAVVMTPLLTSTLVGQYISVDAFALFSSTLQVVLLPVILGAVMNHFFHRYVKKISLVSPTVAVVIVAIVCAGAVGRSSAAILSSGGQVLLAVMALHLGGFAFGYLLSRVLGIDTRSARTISIEVGMQNSVLGVVLAGQHFSNPLTAVPCAVSSVCHSLIGSTLAGFWRLAPVENEQVKLS